MKPGFRGEISSFLGEQFDHKKKIDKSNKNKINLRLDSRRKT